MPYTRQEFAQLIKSKYPVYAGLPDDDLVTRVLDTYPVYRSQVAEAAPRVPAKGPGFLSRALAFPGRAADWTLGTGARAIARAEAQGLGTLRALGVSRTGTPEAEALDKSILELEQRGQDLQAGTTSYGHELAELIPRPKSGALGHAAGVARAGVEFAGDMVRDPTTYAAFGALKRFGLAGKGLAAGASALFAIQAGKEVPAQFMEAVRLYDEDGGWTPRVTEAVAKGALLGAGAALGTLHAARQGAGFVSEAVPKTGGGLVYAKDPKASAADIAAREAADAAQAQRAAEIDAGDAAAIDRASKRLTWEGAAALERQAGDRAMPPKPGSSAAEALARAETAAAEELATGQGARAPVVPRYDRGDQAGKPKLTTKQRHLVHRRLLQLASEEGAQTEAPKGVQGPVLQETPAATSTVGQWVRRALRVVEPSFEAAERLPGVGGELAGRFRAYVDTWERGTGQAESASARALRTLGETDPKKLKADPRWVAIQRHLDLGEALAPELQPVADALAAVRRDQRARGEAAGLEFGDETLWPRRALDEGRFSSDARAETRARARGLTLEQARAEMGLERGPVITTRAGHKAGAEHARGSGREALQPGEYDTSPKAWFDDLRETERRIAEAEHLGKNGEKAQALIERLPKGGVYGDKAFAETLVNRLRGTEAKSRGQALSNTLRAFQSGVGLVKSPISQITTLANTAAETSIAATAKSIHDILSRKVIGPDGKPMRWTQPVKRLRAAFEDAGLDAGAQGALSAGVAEGLVDYATKGAQGERGAFGDLVSRAPHIRLTGWVDNAQRIIAANTAKFIVPDAWSAAKAGKAAAQRQLDAWGVDWRREALTPEMVDRAAKSIADRSQFKVGVGDQPLWATSPWGKVAFQFQSFGYAHTRYVGAALDEARRGNVAPIGKLAFLGAALGYMTNEMKRALFTGQAPEDPTEQDFVEAAGNAFQGRKRYDPTSAKGAALAALEGLGAAGGLGALGSLGDRVTSGDPAKLLLGATGADVSAWTRFAKAAIKDENASQALVQAAAGMAPSLPLGADPREWTQELTSETPPANPGYAGRIRDVAAGKAEPSNLLAGVPGLSALAAPDSPERQDAQRKEREDEARRKASDELATITTKPPIKPISEQTERAHKNRLRTEFRLELAKAIRRGASDDELGRIAERAADAGIRITFKQVEGLRGRVVPVVEDEQ